MSVHVNKYPSESLKQDAPSFPQLQEPEGFSISVLNRAKAFTLRRMTGSLEHRIRRALARFSPGIKKVRLVLEDENGPRGGYDKKASVQVTLVVEPAPKGEKARWSGKPSWLLIKSLCPATQSHPKFDWIQRTP